MKTRLVTIVSAVVCIFSVIYLINSKSLIAQEVNDQSIFTANEKNTISVFDRTVSSVVNIASKRLARSFWGLSHYGEYEVPSGAGSGFVWDTKGHIITNAHVVSNSDRFLVSFHKNKKQYEAELVGFYPQRDIAVLKIKNPPSKVFPVTPGNSSILKVGQKAIAIGNPFELDNTLTTGVVSALNREIKGFAGIKIYGMIQTDASINPGNSGGPLLDSQGRLIGMNTLIFSNSGASAGVGFAVPVDIIKRVVPQLIKHGKVIRPGIGFVPLPDYIHEQFEIKKGIVILKILPGGPADNKGLKGISRDSYNGRYILGDILLKIDDKEINSYDELYNVLDQYKISDEVTLTYLRNDKIKKVKLTLTKLK